MYKIAVMGDYDSIYGYAALGLDTFPVTEREQAAQQLSRLATGEYGIIYITENWAAALEREIAEYEAQVTPAIIRIPGVSGNTGEGIAAVRRSVETAVGSDILFSET